MPGELPSLRDYEFFKLPTGGSGTLVLWSRGQLLLKRIEPGSGESTAWNRPKFGGILFEGVPRSSEVEFQPLSGGVVATAIAENFGPISRRGGREFKGLPGLYVVSVDGAARAFVALHPHQSMRVQFSRH